MKTTKYVAFLRGINVGGNHKLKMDELRNAFTSWGFTNVKTILATGNIIFEAQKTSAPELQAKIKDAFKMDVPIILWTIPEIQKLVKKDPFKGIPVTQQTRLYVTFLSEKSKSKMPIPYTSPEKNFKILQFSDEAIFSVLTLVPYLGTTDAMRIVEKEFGKQITTRNWNTLVKIAEL